MSMIIRALLYTQHIANNLGVIFRKEFTDLRDSTCKDFEKYTGIKIDSKRNVEMKNGSTIMFRHIEELHNIQNINLGFFAIEQVDELETDNEFFLLHGRLRRKVDPDDYFKSLGLAERSGFVIGNVGKQWVKETWKTQKIGELYEATTFDNEDILPADYIQSLRDLEHRKPEVFRRYVMNDWGVEDSDFILIPSAEIEELKTSGYSTLVKGDLITVDPSMGGDECAIYVLRSRQISDKKFMYERDLMKVVGEIMLLSHRHQINKIAIDCIGIGQGMADRLKELGKIVYPINSARKSSNPKFYNLKTEMWFYMMDKIFNKEIAYPNDEELRRQLSSVKYKIINSNGEVKIEAKDETKKRLGQSPDRADAFVQGIWQSQFIEDRNKIYAPYNWRTGELIGGKR